MYLLAMFMDLSWAGKINFLVIGVAMIWLSGWLITGKDELLIFLFLYCLCGVGGVFLMDPNNEIARMILVFCGAAEGMVLGKFKESEIPKEILVEAF